MNENEFKRLLRKGIITFKVEPYITVGSKRLYVSFKAKGDVNSSLIELFRNNKEEIINILNEDKEDFKELNKEYKELRKQK